MANELKVATTIEYFTFSLLFLKLECFKLLLMNVELLNLDP